MFPNSKACCRLAPPPPPQKKKKKGGMKKIERFRKEGENIGRKKESLKERKKEKF